VKEIITSEKRYNKQLLTMIEVSHGTQISMLFLTSEVFLTPLRAALERQSETSDKSSSDSESEDESDSESDTEEKEPYYTGDDIFNIFSHLEIIYNLSNVLISLLEEKFPLIHLNLSNFIFIIIFLLI
jgi:hypothetical protein